MSKFVQEMNLFRALLRQVDAERSLRWNERALTPWFDLRGRLHVRLNEFQQVEGIPAGVYVIDMQIAGGPRVRWSNCGDDPVIHSWRETREFLDHLLWLMEYETQVRMDFKVVTCQECGRTYVSGDGCENHATIQFNPL